MNSKRGLMTMVVGLAMLATPIAAAAKDFKHNDWRGRYVGPAAVARHDFRNRAMWTPPPPALAHRDWHHGWNDHYAYAPRGYYAPVAAAPVYAAPVYAAPAYSGYGYGGGQGCRGAQHVMRTYARDRATGHPAAAADVLRQNQWALHSGCGATVGAGRGLGGIAGYNGGYGQPYGNGSTLAPLMQYFH